LKYWVRDINAALDTSLSSRVNDSHIESNISWSISMLPKAKAIAQAACFFIRILVILLANYFSQILKNAFR